MNWSDTQIIANVSTGSNSGNAQIQQAGLPSNSIPFTVNTATITNLSSTAGLPGTQIAIYGSGFGAVQGSGIVWLGTAAGIVSGWNDGEVEAVVATGSSSGNVQILQNGVWSNPVPFTIDTLHIANVTPNSGAAGTVVTITGGGFGNSQGSGSVSIGGFTASVVEWSDTQLMASVANNTVSGVVKVEQNGEWSNGVTFTVPPSGTETPVTLIPNIISMVVGGTQATQALNPDGQPVSGLTWTSSNTAVATLSTDDPPIITAVAKGTTTIAAGSSSADVTVYPGPTLPTGTVAWSNPGDGSGVSCLIPAIPGSSGIIDVFALNGDGSVQAIANNGVTVWTAPGVNAACGSVTPTFQGGLLVNGYLLDAVTGQSTSGGSGLVATDGTVIAAGTGINGTSYVPSSVGGYNPATGNSFNVPLESGFGLFTSQCGDPNSSSGMTPATVGQAIIAGDGYFYVPYTYHSSVGTLNCDNTGGSQGVYHSRIMRVGTDGSSTEIVIGDWGETCVDSYCSTFSFGNLGTLITNGDQGVLYSWQLITNIANGTSQSIQNEMTTTGTGTVSANIFDPAGAAIVPVLQRQDGSFVGTVDYSGTGIPAMVAFTSSGQQLWMQPNYTPQIATSDGGVIATSQSGQTLTFDASGNQNGQLPSLLTQSWMGNQYQLGSVEQVAAAPIQPAASFNPYIGANPSANGTAGILETLYVRIFAPWKTFGPDPFAYTNGYIPVVHPCVLDCFLGDNRSFTTAVNKGVVTSRINGVVQFLFPGMVEVNNRTYSDLTTAIYRRPPLNTGTSSPIVTTIVPSDNYLDLEFEGADPLVPLAPDIDDDLVITGTATPGQVCYSGWLSGDGFPNTEVFIVNSNKQAKTLLNYATTSNRNAGPWTLLSPITINMGSFSNICMAK